MARHHIENELTMFLHKNVAKIKPNTIYSLAILACLLAAAAWNCSSIENNAQGRPSSDTLFYRLDLELRLLDKTFRERAWQLFRQHQHFWRRQKKQVYVAVDETHEPYTGKKTKKYIQKYKPDKGCTGSFRFIVFSLITPTHRLVIRAVPLAKKQDTNPIIIETLLDIQQHIKFRAALLDRGFFKGSLVKQLQKKNIPFVIRARISDVMRCMLQGIIGWVALEHELGKTPANAGVKTTLILGKDQHEKDWGFLTNCAPKQLWRTRQWYKKRWAIENIFKITDGIRLPTNSTKIEIKTLFFLISMLLYNAWQWTKENITLKRFAMQQVVELWNQIKHAMVKKPPSTKLRELHISLLQSN